VLHYTRLGQHAKYKRSNLLGPFAGYEENEVLGIRTLILLQYFIIGGDVSQPDDIQNNDTQCKDLIFDIQHK
jgi:hypothetical protein